MANEATDHPEFPFLLAGVVAVLGATIRDKKLPDLTTPAIGTVALVLLASMTADSRYAPLVRAFGILLLTATVISATNSVLKNRSKKQ